MSDSRQLQKIVYCGMYLTYAMTYRSMERCYIELNIDINHVNRREKVRYKDLK